MPPNRLLESTLLGGIYLYFPEARCIVRILNANEQSPNLSAYNKDLVFPPPQADAAGQPPWALLQVVTQGSRRLAPLKPPSLRRTSRVLMEEAQEHQGPCKELYGRAHEELPHLLPTFPQPGPSEMAA